MPPKVRHVTGLRSSGPKIRHIRKAAERAEAIQERIVNTNALSTEAAWTLTPASEWVTARGGTLEIMRAAVLAGEVPRSERQGGRYVISPSGLAEWADAQEWFSPV